MVTVYLVRHAEAEGNAGRRIHGFYDSRVTVNGRRQIAALGKRFAEEKVDAVYASDLVRTIRTAEAIALPRGLAVQTDCRFREVGLGVWEDKPFGWLERFDTEKMREFNQSPRTWSVEGSETFCEYTSRFLTAMTEVCEKNDGKTIVIASHGSVLRAVQQTVCKNDDLPYCDNTAVSRLTYENGTYRVDFLNDSTHLPEEISTFARQKWWRRDPDRADYNLWFEERSEGAYRAMLGDEQVGTIRISPESGEIFELVLKENFRNMALGVQLVGQIISTLREAGKETMWCTLCEHPAAEHFLRECGFSYSDGIWQADIRVQ